MNRMLIPVRDYRLCLQAKSSVGSRDDSITKAKPEPTFSFYMGKNTPERKDYIMERLVVQVEE